MCGLRRGEMKRLKHELVTWGGDDRNKCVRSQMARSGIRKDRTVRLG